MTQLSYQQRRGQIETYFDRTAAQAWARLTSDAPVSRIRATVRAGRDQMRATLLSWLPHDLRGLRILDAGCGTGALAVEAAQRGASVLGVDLSQTLIDLARERLPAELRRADAPGSVELACADLLDPALGSFDHVVGMDSLIHYEPADAVRVLAGLAQRTRGSIVFTYAPSNPALVAMRAVGRLFPRGDRAPSIVPVREAGLHRMLRAEPQLGAWALGRTRRVSSGFYTSQALELARR
ncbi:MAG: magnesium protoporphyrin IX methyltransferase [Rhodoferax sp.]|nr:magnesium protoporphyrin IX methyltransferase [Rhodoferax sp.]